MKKLLYLSVFIILSHINISYGLTFNMPNNGDLIGNIQTTTVKKGEWLGDIGRNFNIGVYEMIEANPNLNPWTPTPGATVIIPSEFILPPGERTGLVINLAEMRIYYFNPNKKTVSTYPIGIGKKGWNTPLGTAHIIEKVANPYWRPPQSIREDHAKRGDILPSIIPPGPDNPLGKYAMRLSLPTYLIHGTNNPGGIGFRSTSGCIRLLPEDIEILYPKIPIGTQVRIIHAPYKFGRKGHNIFLEAHQPLSEHYNNKESTYIMLKHALEASSMENLNIDLKKIERKVKNPRGYPILIY